jgi:subtilase family serine protease
MRFSKKTAYWVLGLLLLAGFGAAFLVSPQWSRSGHVVLSGNTPAALNSAQLLNRAAPAQEIEVVLGLNIRDEDKLNQLIAEQNDPSSPNYRKYLSAAEFKNRFSPTQADVDAVVAFLQSNGLTVVEISDNHLLITVKGTVEQLEKAFRVRVNVYSLNSQTHLSNDRDPSVPAQLKGVVRSVLGMSTFAEYQSRAVRNQPNAHSAQQAQPQARPAGLGADDIATAYDYPNMNNANAGTKYSGSGVTIAVATAYGYDKKDIEKYWNTYGVKRTGKLDNVAVGGRTNKLEGETTLDVQQVTAQAPGADVIVYIGANPKFTTFAKVFSKIVSDNKADVVSISWGLCEEYTGPAQIYPEHASFKQGAAQGIAFFAAAGDDGAYDCGEPGKYSADYPAADPYVTAVGGTSLTINADKSRRTETAWTGAGGDTSIEFDRPTWQTGKGIPAGDKRVTSDVSLVADPSTGYSMYFQGKWEVAGGTSFAAPAWAALWGLNLEATGGARMTSNPTFYRIGQHADYSTLFHDITTGNNGNGQGPGHPAGPDWDHPTGWGVPKAEALIQWLVNDTKNPTPSTPEPNKR